MSIVTEILMNNNSKMQNLKNKKDRLNAKLKI